jgi:hypothetical protein
MALVGRPSAVAIDSGRAKNARYARLLPSIRNSSPPAAAPAESAAVFVFVAGTHPS